MKSIVVLVLSLSAPWALAQSIWIVASNEDKTGWTYDALNAIHHNTERAPVNVLWLSPNNSERLLDQLQANQPEAIGAIGDAPTAFLLTDAIRDMSALKFSLRVAQSRLNDSDHSEVIQKSNMGPTFGLLGQIADGITQLAFDPSVPRGSLRSLTDSATRRGFNVVPIDQAAPESTAIVAFAHASVARFDSQGFFVISPWKNDIGRGALLGGSLDGYPAGSLLADLLTRALDQNPPSSQLLQLNSTRVWADYQGLADRGYDTTEAGNNVAWVNHVGVTFEDRAASVVSWLIAGVGALMLVLTWLTVRLNQQRRVQRDLNRLALNDSMTGLANREGFITQADARLSQSNPSDQHAMVFIDLDRFRNINDRYGHDIGNQVIRLVAERLSGLIRGRDLTARMAADQFALLLDNTADQNGLENIMAKLCDSMALPLWSVACPFS